VTVGAGKYDFALTLALGNAEAEQGVLIVFDGKKGAGFSVQASKEALEGLPQVLEHIAAQVRKDLPNLS
jgi:hypothetical protein